MPFDTIKTNTEDSEREVVFDNTELIFLKKNSFYFQHLKHANDLAENGSKIFGRLRSKLFQFCDELIGSGRSWCRNFAIFSF